MSEINLYRVTPRKAKLLVKDVLAAGLVPFLQSSPGMGKSAIYRCIADELNLFFKDHRVSSSAPEDYNGAVRFRDDGTAYFAPFTDTFPIEGMEIPKGKDGWLTLLDEANSLPNKTVEAALYKLVLDKYNGQRKLHPNVLLGMAGNLDTDRAITVKFGTAMKSRVIHIEMETSFDEWLEDVAIPQGYDARIIAYHKYTNGKHLNDFKPDHQDKTFCCQRTWEFMDKLIYGKEIEDEKTPMYAGTITSGVAVDFIQYTKVFHSMVSIKDILADPEKCPVPADTATRWAVVSHMMEMVTEENFEDLGTYADRFDMTFRILFYRATHIRHPKMRRHPAFAKRMVELSRYLND